MIKIRVQPECRTVLIADDYSIDIELPSVPRIGEIVNLGADIEQALVDKLKTQWNYKYIFADWFDSDEQINTIEQAEEKLFDGDLSFEEMAVVTGVYYNANSEYVSIVMGKPKN